MRRSASSIRRLPAAGRSKKLPLTISIVRSAGAIRGFAVSGHAGFAAAGRDVVCAGISALVLSAANGLRRHCGVRPSVRDEPNGDYVLSVPSGGGARAQAVLKTALSGVRAIAAAYPGYVVVREQRSARWTS